VLELQGTRGLLLVYGVGAALGPMAAGPVLERYGPLALALVNAAVLGSLGLVGALRMLVRTPLPLGQQSPFVPLARTSPAALEMHPEVPATHDEPPQAP